MIIRTARTRGFTVVANSLIEDASLGWDAMGLLVYLLSKPDHWKIMPETLANKRNAGKGKIYSLLKQLREAGYVTFRKYASGHTDWLVFDTKQDWAEGATNAPPLADEDPMHDPEITDLKDPNQSFRDDKEVNTETTVRTERATKTEHKKTPPSPSRKTDANDVVAVFDYWREKTGHTNARLCDKRRRLIAARLREGYSVDDLRQAVDGNQASAFHQGQNEHGRVFDAIELIFRSAEKVDGFIGCLKAPKRARSMGNGRLRDGAGLGGNWRERVFADDPYPEF
jgi:uncharacterized phage protein (TIGR02220 family)